MTALGEVLPAARGLSDMPGLADAVSAVLGETPVSVTVERTHFPGSKPVQHVLLAEMADGRRRTVFAERVEDDARSYAAAIRASLSKSRNGQKAGCGASAVVVADGLPIVVRRPGLDERLPGLRLLYDAGFARQVLWDCLGRDPGPVTVELIAHRLGKRAVLRISGDDTEVYARLRSVKSGEGDARYARHVALWTSLSGLSDLRIPEPLGTLPTLGISVFAVLPGRPADFEAADAEAVARAMARLQRLDPQGLPLHRGRDEARLLREWLARCRASRPEVARRIAPGVQQVMARLEEADADSCPCHRDLHEKQILVAGGVAGLLDFDTLCLGHPALDAGNLLAHLYLAERDEGPLRSLVDRPGIGLWRRAALCRLAIIYAFTSTPDAVLDRLIEEARSDAED